MTTQILARYANARTAAIRGNRAPTRDGVTDAVHDARVAVRRLRSTLRTFQPLLREADVDGLRAELRWLATSLGQVRDAQVMSDRLLAAVDAEATELVVGAVVARVQSTFAAEVAWALEDLARDLDDPRFEALLTRLDGLAETELAQHQDESALRGLARKALRRADRKMAVAEAATDTERDAALHDARRAYKRARYAVEPFKDTTGAPADRLANRLAAMQDVLGSHHDSVVARQRLRELGMQAQLDGENAFTYGLLYAHQGQAAAEYLAQVPSVAGRANRSSTRAWLG
jgi:CHAD domain-containing protein